MNVDLALIYTCVSDVCSIANEASFSKHRCRELSRQCKYVFNTLQIKRQNIDHLPSLEVLYDILKECKEFVIKMSTSNPIQKVFGGYNGKIMYGKLSEELKKWFDQLQEDISSYPSSMISYDDDKEDQEKIDAMEKHMNRAEKIAEAHAGQLAKYYKQLVLKGKLIQVGKQIDTYSLGNIYEGLYNYKTKVLIREIDSLNQYIQQGILLNQSLHDCNNILKIHGIVNNMIVYENTMFSLQDLLCYEFNDTLSLCRKIAAGINYIHGCDIVHKDLCPKNIMISHDFTPKITGFEMSRKSDEHTHKFSSDKIDIKYWSPERKEGKNSSKASDVYAFGMIVCDIMKNMPASLETCLDNDQHTRPSMNEVLLRLIDMEKN